MPIDLYSSPVSPPCMSVLITSKLLNIDLNVINLDLLESEHMTPEFLKLNPEHTVPTISDNGFILWESNAIMQYLCDQYAPGSNLYSKDLGKRALVDSLLFYQLNLGHIGKSALAKTVFYGAEPSEIKLKAYKDSLKVFDQIIGNKKYCTGDEMTIADISLFMGTIHLDDLGAYIDLNDYPNVKRWRLTTRSALGDVFEEVFPYDQWDQYFEKRKNKSNANRMAKNMNK